MWSSQHHLPSRVWCVHTSAIATCDRFIVLMCREREEKRAEAATREARVDEQQQALRQKGALLHSLQARAASQLTHLPTLATMAGTGHQE